MKERRPGLVRPGRRFFVCASWLISAVGPSIAATYKCFVFRIVITRGEQGHFVWRIVCNFRNKYPATCCSAFRIRGGVLCNTKTQVMSFMATRKISCVDPSAGFHGSPADGFFKRTVNMDLSLFITITCEAILGCEKTHVPGQDAAEVFEDLKAEMDGLPIKTSIDCARDEESL